MNSVDTIHPNTLFANPFPTGFLYPPGSSQGLLSAIGLSLSSALPSTLRTAYNQQWNFSIQRSLASDMLLQVAYVGNKGTHLAWGGGGGSAGMNMLPPNLSGLGNQLLTLVNNPFYGVITSGPLSQPQIQYGQLLLPFPGMADRGADGIAIGNSEYDALQASYTKRFSKGLSVIAAYTWSKLMTDVANGTWAGTASVRSYYCVRCEHSPSTYDVPHRFTLSAVGELPFGKGKMFGSSWNGVVDAMLGGWQANGILTLASGQPLVFATAVQQQLHVWRRSASGRSRQPGAFERQEHLPVVQYCCVRAAGELHLRQSVANLSREFARTRRRTWTSRCSRTSASRSGSRCSSGPKRSTDEHAGVRRSGHDCQRGELRYHHRAVERAP